MVREVLNHPPYTGILAMTEHARELVVGAAGLAAASFHAMIGAWLTECHPVSFACLHPASSMRQDLTRG